jgi:hypothetical protein
MPQMSKSIRFVAEGTSWHELEKAARFLVVVSIATLLMSSFFGWYAAEYNWAAAVPALGMLSIFCHAFRHTFGVWRSKVFVLRAYRNGWYRSVPADKDEEAKEHIVGMKTVKLFDRNQGMVYYFADKKQFVKFCLFW